MSQPTTLWYGGTDQLVGVEHGQWYRDQVPQARLTVWPGSSHGDTVFGHWPQVLASLVDPT